MSAVVIAKFNSDKDADFVLKFIRKFSGKAKKLKGEALEDFYLGQLIDKGMKSEDVSTEEIKRELRK